MNLKLLYQRSLPTTIENNNEIIEKNALTISFIFLLNRAKQAWSSAMYTLGLWVILRSI